MIFEEDGFDYLQVNEVGREYRRLRDEIMRLSRDCRDEKELAGKLKSEFLNPQEVVRAVIENEFAEEDFKTFKMLKDGTFRKINT
jgi:hypothetical protein